MDTTSYYIRKALANDITAIVVLVNSAFRGDISRQGWTTEADLLDGIRIDEEALKEMLDAPAAVVLLYYEENELLGCVYLQKQEENLYLGMLTVNPGLQNKGIGKKLMNAAEDYAISQHCTYVVMNVLDGRYELNDWYIRQGYKITGETKDFPENTRLGIPKRKLHFNIMKKKLNIVKDQVL
jgi:ribosomal protein S18 acetylase RimI-like enzyme